MLSFENDYAEGAHERILERLTATNREQTPGYGTDEYCRSAAEKIRRACGCQTAEVFFLVGGTQTNQTVIDCVLEPYQGVVAAESGHINTHEAGAVELTGHKVLTLPQQEGKLSAQEFSRLVEAFYADGSHSHMVYPGMVYLSHPTELGTLYTKAELEEIAQVCRRFQMPLYLDGARLGYGLAAGGTDVTLEDIARLCDVFYIGGTKVGAFCGEAVVFTRNNVPKHFTTRIKQHGAMLAKGRFLGLQFDTLFTDGLYLQIGRHGVEMAERLKRGLRKKGYPLFLDSPTNQQFVILENKTMETLAGRAAFTVWQPFDENSTVVRFVTSWATEPEQVDALLALL